MVDEPEQFLACTIYMTLFGLPATRMFWSSSSRVAQVADAMPLTRWEAIKGFLHFSDNTAHPGREEDNFDEFYKIRPLIIDGQMVPFKRQNRLKKYPPKKWGYKLTVALTAHNFEGYKVVQTPELTDIGASRNAALRLAQPVPKCKNYKLYIGNWFCY